MYSIDLTLRDFYIFAPLNSKINTKNYSNTIHKQKESGKAGNFKEKISSSRKKRPCLFKVIKLKYTKHVTHTNINTE